MELCFGRIQHGFDAPTTGDAVDEVQFIECRGGFVGGVSVVSTLGLSRFALESSTSEKKIRQELFFLAKEDQLPDNTAAVLHQVVGPLHAHQQGRFAPTYNQKTGNPRGILSHSTSPCASTILMKCGHVAVKRLQLSCAGSCR
jgi:hypothetical protein